MDKVDGPQTTGATIHWIPQYDFFARLMGLGVKGANTCMVIGMAQVKPGDKVLDVGCGTGDLTLAAQNAAGPTGLVCGIDPAPEGVAVAQGKAGRLNSAARFSVGLIERLDFPEGTFDLAISRLVIHHLPDDLKRKGFADIFRVLKPGGRLFMVDFKPPSSPILKHLAIAAVGHRMMAESRVWEVPQMLADAGFVEVASGPTRSVLMAFVSGRKPAA
jgi:demethylmenaquinone methyltransferase/2-methoxy-6-polyprenyl-1,4-benzoquinol methylase/phosphoethanolamine N-methyltransferase